MSSGSCLTSKLYEKIMKMLSKSHETIPLNITQNTSNQGKCSNKKRRKYSKEINKDYLKKKKINKNR
jgi:hypothetical protein